MARLVRAILIAARWPLAILAFLVAFNVKAGSAETDAAGTESPAVTLTLT